MAEQVVAVQPKVLRWARSRAGYSVEDIAKQLKRDPAEIRAWETGESAPTYAQLEKLAYDLYKRPLALFFLPEPPQEVDVNKTRQIFTLFHELAHLFVGVNSISKVDDFYINELPSQEKRIEQVCNALAADILVPPKDFRAASENLQTLDDDSIQALANRYRVSREVILRLSLDSGNISPSEYSARVSQWASDNGVPSKSSSGGSYYATQATYLQQFSF